MKKRVLVVDDSTFMRAAVARTLTAAGFDVIGQAKDGADAVVQILKLQPDVVTMDFNMPGMNGVEAVRELMRRRPTPVVMFSAHTREGARETLDALAAGAVDFVTKPAGEVSADLSKIADELVRKVTCAAASRPRSLAPPPAPRRATTAPSAASGAGNEMTGFTRAQPARTPGALPRLGVIAVSTGGPAALMEVIPALPGDLRLALIVVQHMPAKFTATLAERLDASSQLSVREAKEGDRPAPGLVLVAPGDRHVELDDTGAITLTDGPLVHGCRPSADITMQAAARVYGRRTVAVVMTGMGKDGTAGALAIKKADGKTVAQDQASSVIFGMPKAAIDAGAIDAVVPLADLAAHLRYL